MNPSQVTLGAIPLDADHCEFRVWAPFARQADVRLQGANVRRIPLTRDELGYHSVVAEGVPPGTDYFIHLDDGPGRPDPASRWQPAGVHGPSRVVAPGHAWTDQGWFGLPLRDYVLYELHVGTFSREGTFDGVIAHLGRLKDLGVTAVELMPVAQFPGSRNWGYDGVHPFAVQDSYGGPEGLKRLVNAAHALGLAVVLDVVYNHLGPEGNYLGEFGPYFTNRYSTPWGAALNFDGPDSSDVRRYFLENALHWQSEFHLDALRLDAVHAIRDFSAITFLEELAASSRRQSEALNRRFHLIAESDMNMARHILPPELGGYGLDAQWSDDFHHALHTLLTGERNGYYQDFGGVTQLGKVWREGYAYTGEMSRYRRHRHGSSPHRNGSKQFVVCIQNHDQVGNRLVGDRLAATLSLEQLKLAAGAVLLSPFIPMLFMGEEYGETAPFQYFISHTDPALVEAVRKGRREEFKAFGGTGEAPDAQAEATFTECALDHGAAEREPHRTLLEFHRELLALRKRTPGVADAGKENLATTPFETEGVLAVRQGPDGREVVLVFNFSPATRALDIPMPPGRWACLIDSALPRWSGPGTSDTSTVVSSGAVRRVRPGHSMVAYERLSRG